MLWKNTTQVFHTAGAPPRDGRIILAAIGSSKNMSDAATASVTANSLSALRSSGLLTWSAVATVGTKGRTALEVSGHLFIAYGRD